mmetsp:Transcript_15254/g.22269  ORF Transcript_15254/g.22269 Transcript_15254/m.22269 type:complete len:163 (+) Transcript_15254:1475-1963(+)
MKIYLHPQHANTSTTQFDYPQNESNIYHNAGTILQDVLATSPIMRTSRANNETTRIALESSSFSSENQDGANSGLSSSASSLASLAEEDISQLSTPQAKPSRSGRSIFRRQQQNQQQQPELPEDYNLRLASTGMTSYTQDTSTIDPNERKKKKLSYDNEENP